MSMRFQLFLEMSELGGTVLIGSHPVIRGEYPQMLGERLSEGIKIVIHRRKELCGCHHAGH